LFACGLLIAASVLPAAQPAGPTVPPTPSTIVAPSGAITSGPLSIPFSHYASDEALAQFLRDATRPPAPSLGGPIDASRRYYDTINSDRVERMKKLYPWGGVYEGIWHSFFSDPELPESRAAYDAMVRFFERHLGR
jgi:monoterpene epsilon-lactone hydrolase